MNFSELNIEMVFALMSGKLSAAINRKLYRSFRKLSIDITPEQWTVLYYLWSRDGRQAVAFPNYLLAGSCSVCL